MVNLYHTYVDGTIIVIKGSNLTEIYNSAELCLKKVKDYLDNNML